MTFYEFPGQCLHVVTNKKKYRGYINKQQVLDGKKETY